MPRPHPALVSRVAEIQPLLRSIATSSGLRTTPMCARLAAEMGDPSANSMQRSWNSWLAPKATLPGLGTLIDVAEAAGRLGWLPEGEGLGQWLLEEGHRRRSVGASQAGRVLEREVIGYADGLVRRLGAEADEVFDALAGQTPQDALLFLVSRHKELGGVDVETAVAQGRLERVVRAARAWRG